MVELQGSEKQVKWALDIRKEIIEIATKNNLKRTLEVIKKEEKAVFFIDNFKFATSKFLDAHKKFECAFKFEMKLEEIETFKKYGW